MEIERPPGKTIGKANWMVLEEGARVEGFAFFLELPHVLIDVTKGKLLVLISPQSKA